MLKIAFLVPSTGISGGVSVILFHAKACHDRGHHVTLLFDQNVMPADLAWHPVSQLLELKQIEVATIARAADQLFDIAIATFWRTVFDLWRVDAKSYAYLVQSIESRFSPVAQLMDRALVDATYDLRLPTITIAHWMADYLRAMYGGEPNVVLNGVDKDIFNERGARIAAREPGKLRVLVEGPVDVPFKNVPLTIDLCRRGGADEVWLLTSSPVSQWAGADRVFSQIAHCRTPEIYRSCDVLIKLSLVEGMFGPPLEIFHCGGTAVVFDVTGHDEYVRHGENGLVVPIGADELVVRWVRELWANQRLTESLKAGALSTAAQWPDWSTSGHSFETALQLAMEQPQLERDLLRTISRRLMYMANIANLTNLTARASPVLEDQIRSLQLAHKLMLASTSWKLTAPLRALKDRYNRFVPRKQPAA